MSEISIVTEPSSGSTSEPTATGIALATLFSTFTAIFSVEPDCNCKVAATLVVFVTIRTPPSATVTAPSPEIAPEYAVDCATVKTEFELIEIATAASLSLLTNVTFSPRTSWPTVAVWLLKHIVAAAAAETVTLSNDASTGSSTTFAPTESTIAASL